jgi:hypothetical protein
VRSRERATKVQDHFGIAVGLKNRTFAFQFAAQLGGVGDVPVVRYSDLALVAGHRKRLRVEQHCVAGSGISRVADRAFARQLPEHFRRENIRHVTHASCGSTNFARRSKRSRRFPVRDAAARRGRGT